ncbi:ferritin heavy chain-like [Fukomys damarensis]|nr:ferritin heavy chain-like [Fukomys damarensis]
MSAMPNMPLVELRQNYHLECEGAVNAQIQLQLYASYIYLSMAMFCKHLDVAMDHFSNFFLHRSHQWKELTEKLMWMQTDRSGFVVFLKIPKPERNNWLSPTHAMESAFNLEKTINQNLLELHELATKKGDPNLCDFLQCHYLRPQVQVLKDMSQELTNIHKIEAVKGDLSNCLFKSLTLREDDQDDRA